ncbi:MAG: ribbon-helix-helix domain-containing protein [Caldilineaceae bacterium]
MAKSNPLQAALDRIEKPAAAVVEERPPALPTLKEPERKTTRAGTVLIGGHFLPEVKQRLRILAAEENTTSQALLEEALDLLFIKKGKEAIRL